MKVPDPALVLLVGPSGSGKSTFAQAHFRPTEIVSSDAIRAMLSNDPGDQGASAEAFDVLAILVNGRLRRGLTTVVDATNLRAANRKRYRGLAKRYGVPTVAIAFDLPAQLYLARNSARPDRVVEDDVVADQADRMAHALADLPAEDYAALYILREPETLGLINVSREPLSS
jgi:protein phosphatase